MNQEEISILKAQSSRILEKSAAPSAERRSANLPPDGMICGDRLANPTARE
jgi:hypothetical protein